MDQHQPDKKKQEPGQTEESQELSEKVTTKELVRLGDIEKFSGFLNQQLR